MTETSTFVQFISLCPALIFSSDSESIHTKSTRCGLLGRLKQECIPVGCVPAAHRSYAGVCFPGGGCLVWGVMCLVLGGVCLVRGGCAWSGGGSASVPCGIPPPPPVNRMTNRCKNITLATIAAGNNQQKLTLI